MCSTKVQISHPQISANIKSRYTNNGCSGQQINLRADNSPKQRSKIRHHRKINIQIHKQHERAWRLVYHGKSSSFENFSKEVSQ